MELGSSLLAQLEGFELDAPPARSTDVTVRAGSVRPCTQVTTTSTRVKTNRPWKVRDDLGEATPMTLAPKTCQYRSTARTR